MKLAQRDVFYETLYFHEIAERDRLDDRFRTLLAIVAVVFGIIAFLFNRVVLGTVPAPLMFWLMYALSAIAFAAAVTCYIKAWHSQHYKAFPLPRDIEAYIEQVREHYQALTDERTAAQWTEEAYEDFMRQSFIDHASFNAVSNDSKRFWIYYGNSFVIGAFVFSIMAVLPVADRFVN